MAEPVPETSAASFSGLVSSAAWRADVEEWVHDRVDDHGGRVTGPLDQRRVSAWSTQIVVPTDAGPLWFKANCPSQAFEPALQELLASVVPDDVDRPYAIDVRRGWMMTSDRGSTLAESHETTVDDWCAVVTTTAHLQRMIATHREEVLATGVEDCSPSTVPQRFEMLVDRYSSLPSEHPSHADTDLRAELLATLPRLIDACAQIEASPIPVTLQHGDLHPGNVFATSENGSRTPRGLRVFDFGDAQWAPAVEVLSVPYGITAEAGQWPWQPVLDAYTAQWQDVVDARSLHAMWGATAFTQPVNRSLTWWGALAGASEKELADWGIAPLHHLKRVLEA